MTHTIDFRDLNTRIAEDPQVPAALADLLAERDRQRALPDLASLNSPDPRVVLDELQGGRFLAPAAPDWRVTFLLVVRDALAIVGAVTMLRLYFL